MIYLIIFMLHRCCYCSRGTSFPFLWYWIVYVPNLYIGNKFSLGVPYLDCSNGMKSECANVFYVFISFMQSILGKYITIYISFVAHIAICISCWISFYKNGTRKSFRWIYLCGNRVMIVPFFLSDKLDCACIMRHYILSLEPCWCSSVLVKFC